MIKRPIILTGFMGSGKSSVGKILAERLGIDLVDLDAEIVLATGCSINEIFAANGEKFFRDQESACLDKILSSRRLCVVATGGGAVISEKNRFIMRKHGVLINLNVSLQQVLARLSGCDDRPLLAFADAAERASALISEREQFYADADIRIDTDGKSVEDVAIEILCCLEGFQE